MAPSFDACAGSTHSTRFSPKIRFLRSSRRISLPAHSAAPATMSLVHICLHHVGSLYRPIWRHRRQCLWLISTLGERLFDHVFAVSTSRFLVPPIPPSQSLLDFIPETHQQQSSMTILARTGKGCEKTYHKQKASNTTPSQASTICLCALCVHRIVPPQRGG
ncbi:unnamed protein product [Ectocarpus sp. 12 AP-2014]